MVELKDVEREETFKLSFLKKKKAEIVSWVDDDASLTLNELCERVRQKMDIVVSKSTINRCLKAFHHSLKIMSIVPEKSNDQRTLRLRREYAHKFNSMVLNFEHKRFVFLDEVGFSVTSRTKRGRSVIGTPAVMSVGATRSRNISVFASCNCLGMIEFTVNNRPVNSEEFKFYTLRLKSVCNEKGIKNSFSLWITQEFTTTEACRK